MLNWLSCTYFVVYTLKQSFACVVSKGLFVGCPFYVCVGLSLVSLLVRTVFRRHCIGLWRLVFEFVRHVKIDFARRLSH